MRLGLAGLGREWSGMAGSGWARHGMELPEVGKLASGGYTGQGLAWHGMAERGGAWLGSACRG